MKTYTRSVTDFFRSPQWVMNLLFCSILSLIPFLGPLLIAGWCITCFWAQGEHENPTLFPPFDFQCFKKYIKRGLRPYWISSLGLLLVCVAGIPLFRLFYGLLSSFFSELLEYSGDPGNLEFPIGIFLFHILLFYVIALTIFLISVPLKLKATLYQTFPEAFDFHFVKIFLRLTWKDTLRSLAFTSLLNLAGAAIALITCGIGALFLPGILIYSSQSRLKRLYELYLLHGGEKLKLSPSLDDLPPPLPDFSGKSVE